MKFKLENNRSTVTSVIESDMMSIFAVLNIEKSAALGI